MTSPSTLGVRCAVRAYASVWRWAAPLSLRRSSSDALATFASACAVARRRGRMALVWLWCAEVIDLLRLAVAPRRLDAEVFARTAGPAPIGRGLGLGVDIRHALRAIRARRLDAALAVLLLSLGLTTTGAIYAVTDALLLRPAPFPQPHQLVQIWSTVNGNSILAVPRDLAVRWLDRTDLFASGGVYKQVSALVTDNGDPQIIGAAALSPGLLESLGVRPRLGRTFLPGEGHSGTDRVVIISAELWASRFGSTPDVLSRTLTINGAAHAIVGVMDASFRFPFARQRVWLPYDARTPSPEFVNDMVSFQGRMAPGLTRAQLAERVTAAAPGIAAQALKPWKMGAMVHFSDDVLLDPSTKRSIWLLLGATVMLMLAVCANVANLGLSQALARVRDSAIRSALGASRARMVRAALIEQSLIGLVSLTAALPLTALALRIAVRLLPQSYTVSSLNPVDVDARLIVVMALLALAAPILAGLVPAFAGSRPDVMGALRLESRAATGSRASRLFRRGLVVVEVACSVVLLVVASLLVRSFVRMQAVETGFDHQHVVSVSLGFPAAAFADGIAREAFLRDAVARLKQVPGVEAASAATGVPPDSGGISFGSLAVEGGATVADFITSMYFVQPDFFSTMGISILDGRPLAASDPQEVAVVSASMAQKYWPGQTAVGRRFKWDDTWMTVVGVAATVRETQNRTVDHFPQIYQITPPGRPAKTPPRDAVPSWHKVAVRSVNPAAVIPLVRPALREVHSGILIDKVDRAEDLLAKDLDRPRFLLALMIVFAGAGLVLAALGLYGVLSCLVGEQLREYGIRLMLGAAPAGIVRSIVGGAVGTAAVGLAVGLAGAYALGRSITVVLFEVQPRDVWSYVAVSLVVLCAALAAAWRPARRAAGADPAALLK